MSNLAILYRKIDKALQEYDIEGLISIGAPDSEYEVEAKEIFEAIYKLNPEEIKVELVSSIISKVWSKMFTLDELDLSQRQEIFDKIAQQLVSDISSEFGKIE